MLPQMYYYFLSQVSFILPKGTHFWSKHICYCPKWYVILAKT